MSNSPRERRVKRQHFRGLPEPLVQAHREREDLLVPSEIADIATENTLDPTSTERMSDPVFASQVITTPSIPPDATVLESLENATACTIPECPTRGHDGSLWPWRQIHSLRKSCPRTHATSPPLAASQILTVKSALPVAMRSPSGETTTAFTCAVWPLRVRSASSSSLNGPVPDHTSIAVGILRGTTTVVVWTGASISQTLASLPPPPLTNRCPSGKNDTEHTA
eukprot:CAMPEP_0180168894 /NCGR_PEP_ID=MMETSP0986-20121125/32938_1 /TAXON_ID=697907 /ORGANISM="non described non described, Strain CCMP2293" /LENGTH=223 /DNA_ID=CAMNT_0022120351 /DNA_START=29 /DNA_END=697 /DNA_ORIENTATION=-